jgi:hypothetical protein
VEQGFVRAAKFLHMLSIYRIFDLPYQSQIIPLAAILADIPDALEHAKIKEMLVRWYWNGVFGELYSSAVETRIARDFMEVPAWLRGGPEPSTVSETMFRADRLKTMRMRLSAAYKGVNALLMTEGAKDFRSGQKFGHAIFFEENVDIHHIFPQDWCKEEHIKPEVFDSIINKTPLSCKTNRIIGGVAPSEYLAKLEKGDGPIARERLYDCLRSHLIDPELLYADRFEDFMADRQKRLLALIEQATGKAAYVGSVQEEGEENEVDEDAAEAAMTIPAAGEPVLKDEAPPRPSAGKTGQPGKNGPGKTGREKRVSLNLHLLGLAKRYQSAPSPFCIFAELLASRLPAPFGRTAPPISPGYSSQHRLNCRATHRGR